MAAADSGWRGKTRLVAYGGLLGGLTLLFLAGAAWSPTANLAFFTLASMAIAVAVIETGFAGGCLLYGATAMISLAWPGFAFAWPYVFFFGLYPLLRVQFDQRYKPNIARLGRLSLGVLLACLPPAVLGGLAAKTRLPLPDLIGHADLGSLIWPVLLALAIVAVLIYDWALSMMIALYARRISKKG